MVSSTAVLVSLCLISSSLAATIVDKYGNVPAYHPGPVYITPLSPSWPNATTFAKIGAKPNVPWALPCYPGLSYNITACTTIQDTYLNSFARSDQPGATQMLNWEDCLGKQCLLDSLATKTPQVGICNQGRVPPYYVTINSALDAIAAVDFAVKSKIKIIIKNTGHEYLGRSSGPDGLQLWTHKLNSLHYNATFRPIDAAGKTCAIPANTAVIMGSGAQARDVYKFASDNGKVITLGTVGSVGVGGGYAQGGGHSPLGSTYGMGVDNVLEYRVVVSDGSGARLVTANGCQNQDLYSALRGGGGGSWGVVISTVYKVYPDTGYLSVNIDVAPSTLNLLQPDVVLADYLNKLAEVSVELQARGWSGYVFLTGTNVSLNYGNPGVKGKMEDVAPFFNYLASSPLYKVTASYRIAFPHFINYAESVLFRLGDNTAPVAFGETLNGRLIPASQYATRQSRSILTDALIKSKNMNAPQVSLQGVLGAVKPVAYQLFMTGPPITSDIPKCTGNSVDIGPCVHPAWRQTVNSIAFAQGWQEYFPPSITNSLTMSTNRAGDPLRDLTPGGGVYYSESNIFEESWQSSYWGKNYPALQMIKQKWDPENVFNVYKGVSYTGAATPVNEYRCYSMG